MKTAKIFWTALLVGLALTMPAQAVPQLLGYQGRLVNADGTADSKVQKFRFSVWDLATGGVKKWEETQDIGLTNGFYATYLGQMTAFPTALFDGSDLYLQVSLIDAANNEEILTPRQRVGSVAYALRAGIAQSVAGGGTVDATTVTVNGQPALTSVSATAPIAGSGTATSPLALVPCSQGEILKWNGTAWACSVDLNGSGTVTAVTASAPLTSSGGTAPNLSISAAGTTGSGYLTSLDWNTFNNKLDVVNHDTSLAGTGTVASTLGLKACLGGQILKWNGTTNVWECAADANSGGTVTAVTATGPLSSSGGTTPNLAITAAGTASSGYLSSADWNTFSNKVSSISGTAPIVSSGGVAPTLSIQAATPTSAGSMSAADKAKLDGVTPGAAVASVGAVGPLASSGGTTPNISITACPVGQILKSSGAAWGCAQDNDTTYSAGTGLLLAGTTFSVSFGNTAGTVTQGNDPRLSDARVPTAGSNDYIQNQSAASQAASFAIAGTGAIGGSLTLGGDVTSLKAAGVPLNVWGNTGYGFGAAPVRVGSLTVTTNYTDPVPAAGNLSVQGKIAVRGGPSWTQTFAGLWGPVTYTHNLGYIPFCTLINSTAGNTLVYITGLTTTTITVYNWNTGSNVASGTLFCW